MEKFKTAVVLAGGESKRMGFDKQTLALNDTRLLDRTIVTLKSEFEEIIVVTNRFDLYCDHDLLLIKDEIPSKGPLGGIHSALKICSGEYAYVIACDMPNINTDYIKYMKKRIGTVAYDACITRLGQWIEPFNAFYSKNITGCLETALMKQRTSVFSFLKDLHCLYIEEEKARSFSRDWRMFFNINTCVEFNYYKASGGNDL